MNNQSLSQVFGSFTIYLQSSISRMIIDGAITSLLGTNIKSDVNSI